MLNEARTKFAMIHWEAVRAKDLTDRYEKLIEIWGIEGNLGEVLEIGTGPRGGVLPFVRGSRKVGLDPLYEEYKVRGLLIEFPNIEYREGCIEKIAWDDQFDTVLTANTLDHGESDFRSLRNIARLLKLGGQLFLHVHLRRLDQLNVGHDHILTLEQYEDQIVSNGFKEEWRRIYETDPLAPIEGRYKTLVSCLRR